MKSLKDTIEFKGTKDGFIIVINNEADYEEARKNLIDKINSNLFFFKGSQFCDIYATNLNEKEKLDLINFLKEKYNINFSKKEKAIINIPLHYKIITLNILYSLPTSSTNT